MPHVRRLCPCVYPGAGLTLQLDALLGAGCERIFTAQASGAQRDRSQLHTALDYLRPDDTLVVWKLDRLARSLHQLLDTVEALHRRQMGLRSMTEAIDTSTPGGTLVLSPPSVYTALVPMPMLSCEETRTWLPSRNVLAGCASPRDPLPCRTARSVLVEIERQTLSRVHPDGAVSVVAALRGGPNGAAMGPAGRCYVCNNGGSDWYRRDDTLIPGLQGSDYHGGSIQAVDLTTGAVETVYTHSDQGPLRGPNDLVFDAHGGLWFTDLGKTRRHDMDRGCVCYARADGSACTEVIRAMMTPNGIGLSPDDTRLYVAETIPGRVWWWEITAPGQVRIERTGTLNRGHLLVGVPDYQEFDSLAVDSAGYVCVATLHNGGITVIAPDGSSVAHVPMPDAMTTNICFGDADLRTAYITLSQTGRLVSVPWPRPGLGLHYLHR